MANPSIEPLSHLDGNKPKLTKLRFRALSRYRRLLSHYLRPEWPRMVLLAAILAATISVQIVAPLVASRFIDRAIAGADLRDLISLAILTMGLALVGQGVAVA